MSKGSSVLKAFFEIPFEDKLQYIEKNFNDDVFESFMVQKGFEKVYRLSIESHKKDQLVAHIINSFDTHFEEATNVYHFIECFFPVADDIRKQIKKIIADNFENSLIQFYYYLGLYVSGHPLNISTAKHIIISIANDVLSNDLEIVNFTLSISFASNKNKKIAIEKCYDLAIKLGVLIEKYDAICFGREKIASVSNLGVPRVSLLLSDQEYEYGLLYGSAFNNIMSVHRANEEPGVIHHFYKCMICKYCGIYLIEDSIKDNLFELLSRQFAVRNLTDIFFYFTGDVQSYLFSLVAYIYVKILLLFFCTSTTMQLIPHSTIKKEILWGDRISEEEYNLLIKCLTEQSAFNNWVQYTTKGIIIGRWQLDLDISIPEMVNKTILNSHSHSELGKVSNVFGKSIYEKIVRDICEKCGWKVVPYSIRKKEDKKTITDIDLLAYNDGIVIVGQIKIANCGRTPYELWKAKQVIQKAIEQENLSIKALNKDGSLLFSILKKNNIVENKNEIKTVIPIIITSSSYYLGFGKHVGIPVVCLDMYQQILSYLNEINSPEKIKNYLDNPFDLYDVPINNTIEKSIIDQDEFYIEYEEIEEIFAE